MWPPHFYHLIYSHKARRHLKKELIQLWNRGSRSFEEFIYVRSFSQRQQGGAPNLGRMAGSQPRGFLRPTDDDFGSTTSWKEDKVRNLYFVLISAEKVWLLLHFYRMLGFELCSVVTLNLRSTSMPTGRQPTCITPPGHWASPRKDTSCRSRATRITSSTCSKNTR